MFASTLALYVMVFSSSYSAITNNSRSKMFMEKHRANMARSTTAIHTIHETSKKHDSMFSVLNIKEIQ